MYLESTENKKTCVWIILKSNSNEPYNTSLICIIYSKTVYLKCLSYWDGEMAERLRVPSALSGDKGSIPRPTWQFTTMYNFNPRESDVRFLASMGTRHTLGVHTPIQILRHTHKKNL